MNSYVQEHVGIRSNRNKSMIAEFMKNTASAALVEEVRQKMAAEKIRSRNVTLSVEGNISAGKSTFLKGITDHCPDLQSLMHVGLFWIGNTRHVRCPTLQ